MLMPKFGLMIEDLGHPAVVKVLENGELNHFEYLLNELSQKVLHTLYRKHKALFAHAPVPPFTKLTLFLRDFDGVAYTIGKSLESDGKTWEEKEIHLSLSYVDGIDTRRFADEVRGVILHELVHAYQYDASGSCPGGLIEGIADYVRLQWDLGPPHWKRQWEGKRWDDGYDTTGGCMFVFVAGQRTNAQGAAFFLEYIAQKHAPGFVQKLNARMYEHEWNDGKLMENILGTSADDLWIAYGKSLPKE